MASACEAAEINLFAVLCSVQQLKKTDKTNTEMLSAVMQSNEVRCEDDKPV
jgi:hypothetical protein